MKKISIFILSVILALCTGCSGTSKVSQMTVASFLGQQEITLPIDSPKAVKGDISAVPFESNMSIDEIYDKLDGNEQYQLEMGGRGILISAPNSKNNLLKEYYSICKMSDNKYCFNDMQLQLTYEIDEEKGNKTLRILFPFHCLTDPKFVNYYDALYTGQEYEVSQGLDYFYEFYQNSGWLDVEKGESWIQINSLKAEPGGKYEQVDHSLPCPIRIYFGNEGDKFYITMQQVKQ